MKGLLLALAALPALAQTQTGVLSGTVTSDDGQMVAGATALYTRVVVLKPGQFWHGPIEQAQGETPLSSSVQSDGSGHFTVAGLPPGNYLVCAEANGAPLLNPCKWAVSYNANVAAGGQATVSIVMQRGVFLNVRVNDPGGLLPLSPASPLDFPHLIVGVVFGAGGFVAAETVNVDTTGRDFQMPVPAEMPLSLWLHSRLVTVANSSQVPVGNLVTGARIPFQASAGQDQSFTFQVTGAAQ